MSYGFTSYQATALDRWLTTPPDDEGPESTVDYGKDGSTPVCSCGEYAFPHRPGSGTCESCPECWEHKDYCACWTDPNPQRS